MIAKVIVDIPTMQTNKPFDYLIPTDYEGWLERGMRVLVPFGHLKRQGYVIDLVQESETDLKKLKKIEEIIDEVPILTEELLNLGRWLSTTTLCFIISAYQVMLPSVMKATYKKQLTIRNNDLLKDEFEDIYRLFQNHTSLDWKEVMTSHPRLMVDLQKAIQQGAIDLTHIVGDKRTSKKVKVIHRALSKEQLNEAINSLNSRADKQKQVLLYFIKADNEVLQSDVLKDLSTTRSTIKSLIDKGYLKESDKEILRDPYANRSFKPSDPLALTKQQQEVMDPILEDIEQENHRVYLCHGVTGSGKTEIYLQTIARVMNKGKQAIVLVPEIALTPMMVERFKSRFGSNVAVLHSGLSNGEKYDEWRKIHLGEVNVVVGARSAIFAPFKNLGIIIIDEEHETSYKQEENPRYHARDVAIYRGEYHQCPVILGSATPSLESYARAKKGVYRLSVLDQRINQRPMPPVSMIDMREELRNGNRTMFSTLLFEKLQDRLKRREQSVLFLNRRGYSTFVMCRDCGYVIQCPHCEISLTHHQKGSQLKCHYCGYSEQVPSTCPSCGSEHIRFFGSGTQKVEAALAKYLPEAKVIRMDVDTTSRKGSHEKLLSSFGRGEADILLGTQMIAKGLDFPKVTLVGVLAADTMLHLPDFRASEKTFQLLTQVSGRAGRHDLPGEVVVQSYTPNHYAINLASAHNYPDFYLTEMMERKRHHYPPFYFLTLVTVSHKEVTKTVAVTEKISRYLKQELSNDAMVLGPAASSIPRIKDRYRYQCMIKYKNERHLETILANILEHYQAELSKEGLQISIDMNPYVLM